MQDTPFQIRYDHLSETNEVILYMKRVSIVLDSQISGRIAGENPPSFFYHVEGTDAAGVNHEYHVMVQVGDNNTGTNTLGDIFAGNYTVTQIPVQRYIPGDAVNILHAVPSGIHASADVLNNTKAEVLFPYGIQQYGGFGHTDSVINRIK